jgi:hypothetical protein
LLIATLAFIKEEVTDKQLLTKHNTRLIYDVIKFSIVFFQNLVIIIFFVVLVVFEVLIAYINATSVYLITFIVILRVEKLFENVLNLLFELVVGLVHEVLQYFWHTQLFCFLSQLLPCKDTVERTVYIRSHL